MYYSFREITARIVAIVVAAIVGAIFFAVLFMDDSPIRVFIQDMLTALVSSIRFPTS